MNVKPLLAAAALLLAASACDTVPIDTADASPPNVVIKIRQGTGYVDATKAKLGLDPVELMAVVEDPNGVKSLRLEFLGSASDTCTVGSSVFSGTFAVKLPAKLEQQLKGNGEGEVLTKFPLLATVEGNQTCTVFGQQQKGRPIGHVVTARATATNWGSSTPAVAELKLTIQ